MTPGLLQGLAEDLYGRFGDAERQFITNIGGGFDFSSGDASGTVDSMDEDMRRYTRDGRKYD